MVKDPWLEKADLVSNVDYFDLATPVCAIFVCRGVVWKDKCEFCRRLYLEFLV